MKLIGMSLIAIALAACGSQRDAAPTASALPEGEPATVRHVQLEGGCWALDTKGGRVQPIDLPEEYQQDGLEVTVLLRDAESMMSVCQIGPLKQIEKISRAR